MAKPSQPSRLRVNAVLCAASCVFGSIHAFAVPRAPHRHVAASAEKSVRRSKVLEMRRLATSENGDQSQSSTFDPNLSSSDPEVYAILQAESRRQRCGLELIASENFASKAVLQALGSVMANKYSEGRPGARYYGGNEHVDELELLCEARALKLFGLSPDEWGVNVQPYSGSPANFAAFTALLEPHDRLMGLDLPSGGHLTHGYYNDKRKVSATSIYFESLPYSVNPDTGIVDYAALKSTAAIYKPKLIVCGASAYPREWDYVAMREAADSCGAMLLTDMAHVSGLVAAGVAESPFACSDVVTSTTHKSLRGPRAGVIFYRKHLKEAIDFAVFPTLQGGPHNHAIAALAVALQEASQPPFKTYATQVVRNSGALGDALVKRGFMLTTGGTDNHLVLWDLRPLGLTGSKMEKLLERASISANKNAVPGDKSALAPGGVRLGTCAMTTRGLREDDFDQVAEFLARAVALALDVQAHLSAQDVPSKKLVDFVACLEDDDRGPFKEALQQLRSDVEAFAEGFPMPGPEVGGPLPL